MTQIVSVFDSVLVSLGELPAGEQSGPVAAIALALAKTLDDDPTPAGAAAASKELLSVLAKLGLISMSLTREVSPNAVNKKTDVGDELDKLRRRRTEYDIS